MFFRARPPNENLSGRVSQPSLTSRVRPQFSENTCQDGHTASFSSQIITDDGNKRPQCSLAVTQYSKPPEYNNRFTRMNNNRFTRMSIDKDVIIRTGNGFVDFFNSNASHMLKEVWEKVIIPGKRFEGIPEARKTLVEDRSPRSVQPSSASKVGCFGELGSKPDIVDLTAGEEEEPLPPSSSLTPFSDKENIQQKSVGSENKTMDGSHVPTKSMGNQSGGTRQKPKEPPGTYDCNFKKRCRKFMAQKHCIERFCQYLHSFPKDDDILCKDFEKGFCHKTQKQCWFKHVEKQYTKRCYEFLTNRWCSKRSNCNYLHRLPKDDNIPCNFFLSGNCKYGRYECIYLHQKEEKDKEKTLVAVQVDKNACDKKIESSCKTVLPKDDDILCKRFQAGDCLESAESAELCNFKHGEASNTIEGISEKALEARDETSEGNNDTHNALGSCLRGVHPIENSQDDAFSSKTTAALPTNVNTGGSHAEGKHVSEMPKSNAVSNVAVKMTVSVSPNQFEIPVLAKNPPPEQQCIDNNGKPLSEVGKINIVKDCDQSQIFYSQGETNKPKSVVPDTKPSLVKSLEKSQIVMNSHDSKSSNSLSPLQTERKLHDAPPRVELLNEQLKPAPVEHRDINSQTEKQPTESAIPQSPVSSQNLESEPRVVQPSAQPTVIEGGPSCQSADTGIEGEISKPEPSVSNVDALTLNHHDKSRNGNVKLNDKRDSGDNFENMSRVEPMNEKSEGIVSESAEELGLHKSTEDSIPGKRLNECKQKSMEAPVQSLVVKDREFRCVDMAEETSQPKSVCPVTDTPIRQPKSVCPVADTPIRQPKSVCPVTDTPIRPRQELPTGMSSQDDSSSQSVKPLQPNRNPAEVSHGSEISRASPITSHLPCKSKRGESVIKAKCKSESPSTKFQHKRNTNTVAVGNMTDTRHVKVLKQCTENRQKAIQSAVQSLTTNYAKLHCVDNKAETDQLKSFSRVTETHILKSPKEVQIDRKVNYNQSSQSVKPLQVNKDPAEVVCLTNSDPAEVVCLTNSDPAEVVCLTATEKANCTYTTPCKKSKRQSLFSSSSSSDPTDEFSEIDDVQYKKIKLTWAQKNKIDIEQESVDGEVRRMVKKRNRDAPAFKKRKHLPCEEDSSSSVIKECKPQKSLKPKYYVRDDGSGFPVSSATAREDLFYVIGRIVGFQGIPQEEDFSELYSEFARLFEELTQWKLLKSEKSDQFIVLEANVRILIACIYNDEAGALKIRDSLVEHWRREPDLKAFKKRMELVLNNC